MFNAWTHLLWLHIYLLMLMGQGAIKLAFLEIFVAPELSVAYHAVKTPLGDQVIIIGAGDLQI